MSNFIVYRVGEGRSPSGKILDRGTQWFTELGPALDYAKKTNRTIYKKENNRRYEKFM